MKVTKLDSLRVTLAAVVLSFTCGYSRHGRLFAETIIYESATLGQTGLTLLDMSNQSIPGYNVRGLVFQGVRFHIDSPVLTTKIGGHFIASEGGGTFFGAIVRLSDEFDLPDSANLSTADVLGVAEITFPDTSEEVFGDLNLELQPGWFSLVFGSELFSTRGKGASVGNGTDLGTPSYFGWQPSAPNLGWIDFSGGSLNHRFVVEGTIIPEPASVWLLLCAGSIFLVRKSNRIRR